jgi:8-oxo-dGTP diphosphatase
MVLKEITDNFLKRPYGWFVKTFRLSPVVSVAAVISKGDSVLLLNRGKKFYLVGGFVSAGERLKDALRREVKEETGLEVSVGRLIGYYDNPKVDPFIPRVMFAYECRIKSGRLRSTYEGKPVFVKKKKLPHVEYDGDLILRSYISR